MSAEALQQQLGRIWRSAYTLPRIIRRVSHAGRNLLLGLAINAGFRFYAARVGARKVMS